MTRRRARLDLAGRRLAPAARAGPRRRRLGLGTRGSLTSVVPPERLVVVCPDVASGPPAYRGLSRSRPEPKEQEMVTTTVANAMAGRSE